jgi:hypothetical protein
MEKRMTLEQILDGGYVVAADDWLNMIVVWNGSGTFNVWAHVEGDAYRNTDCFTRYQVSSAFEAKRIARKWLANVYEEMDGYFNREAA